MPTQITLVPPSLPPSLPTPPAPLLLSPPIQALYQSLIDAYFTPEGQRLPALVRGGSADGSVPQPPPMREEVLAVYG